MKKIIAILILCFLTLSVQAQQVDEITEDYSKNVQTLDSTIESFYTVLSGEKGEKRNWKLFKYLFKHDAKLIPSGKNSEGIHMVNYLSPDDYIKKSKDWMNEEGFVQKEVHRNINTFGNISQVFSTFETYHSHTDDIPFMRGIYSIQLLNDEERWWIVNIYWTQETEDHPIPEVYLPKKINTTRYSYE